MAQRPQAAPLFLILAAAIVWHGSTERMLLAVYGVSGFLVELIGSHTGFPFGSYRYTAALGPALFGVPLSMMAAWVVLLAFARDLAARATAHRRVRVLLGSIAMTAFDLLIDPVATAVLGYWQWRNAGPWFGIPLSNFTGWFAVSALMLGYPRRSPTPTVIGFSILLFFAFMAVTP